MRRSSHCSRGSAISWLGLNSTRGATVRGGAVAVLRDVMSPGPRCSRGGGPALARGNGATIRGGRPRGSGARRRGIGCAAGADFTRILHAVGTASNADARGRRAVGALAAGAAAREACLRDPSARQGLDRCWAAGGRWAQGWVPLPRTANGHRRFGCQARAWRPEPALPRAPARRAQGTSPPVQARRPRLRHRGRLPAGTAPRGALQPRSWRLMRTVSKRCEGEHGAGIGQQLRKPRTRGNRGTKGGGGRAARAGGRCRREHHQR